MNWLASGAEHYFSHLWELDHLGQDWSRRCRTASRWPSARWRWSAFYERFFLRDVTAEAVEKAIVGWPAWETIEADIRSRLSGTLADHLRQGDPGQVHRGPGPAGAADPCARQLGNARCDWRSRLIPARELQAMLKAAGAPSVPEDIGITAATVKDTFLSAAYYRSRYSVLDLARELGWFDELVDEVFAPGGLWSELSPLD